ncbi:MAG TPA: HAMP domain-containing sensor histidine kinase [Vicinamibacterales bacterium]
MNRLRHQLITAFLAATLLPLAATVLITTTLLDRSLRYATTGELDHLARTLETTGKQFYQRERAALKDDVAGGRIAPIRYDAGARDGWPPDIRAFWDGGDADRVGIAGPGGGRVEYLRRAGGGVEMYTRDLGGIRMEDLSVELGQTRRIVNDFDARDLHRGFTLALLALIGAVWLVSLVPVAVIAHRISRPIQQLTAALTDFAGGDWSRRLEAAGPPRDEVGMAVAAFNAMADQLADSRERLVYLTRIASWQSLARKTAHELKNSLTPIRLTVEEIQARHPADRAFVDHAVQIVISEIESLERRVRAFSEFAGEPPAAPEIIDINALVTERAALLRPVHPETSCLLQLDGRHPRVDAAPDLVKGILTNLLQNAAEAAGAGGSIVARTTTVDGRVAIEVHDSGPGLSADALATLFEPTITFKKDGMGLGLSIVKKNAVLCGGDVTRVPGELGGAAFRVTLPAADAAAE